MPSEKTPYSKGTHPHESCGVACTWYPWNGRIVLDLPEWWLAEQCELATPRIPSGMTEGYINQFVRRTHGR